MAEFRGTVKGSGQPVSRLGGRKTGMVTTCNSLNIGVRCQAFIDEGGNPVIKVYRTGGSNSAICEELIAEVK